MKICGIITEYNPFHNGHQYHIQKAKEETGADFLVAVMSGNFVQRGTCAVFDKYERAGMALQSGVDLVLELPAYSAVMSAQSFAEGAVSLLDALSVDSLCFGSESRQLSLLDTAASILCREPEDYSLLLKQFLKEGMSFPKARNEALSAWLQKENHPDREELQSLFAAALPNDLLGIEYLCALKRRKSNIKPYCIRRLGSYHDTETGSGFSSASAIRKLLSDVPAERSAKAASEGLQTDPSRSASFRILQNEIPESVWPLLQNLLQKEQPMQCNDFSLLLLHTLVQFEKEGYTQFADVSEELSDRIGNTLSQFETIQQYTALLKTRELTYTRVSRALLHILLQMKKETFAIHKNLFSYVPYCKVLGFRKDAAELVGTLAKNASCPFLTNLSDTKDRLDPQRYDLFLEELRISSVYEVVRSQKNRLPLQDERSRKMLVV